MSAMPTKENLEAAFAGESQANRTYLAFAKKADREGYPQIARLFRAAAEAETVHAHAHLRVLGVVKATAENLEYAAEGEAHEFRHMYPGFVTEAEAEKNEAAAMSFRNAMAVEEIHHGLYREAAEALKGGRDLPETPIFVCGVCGNTVAGEPPDICPICQSPRSKFSEIM
jgi:rubrerythrin